MIFVDIGRYKENDAWKYKFVVREWSIPVQNVVFDMTRDEVLKFALVNIWIVTRHLSSDRHMKIFVLEKEHQFKRISMKTIHFSSDIWSCHSLKTFIPIEIEILNWTVASILDFYLIQYSFARSTVGTFFFGEGEEQQLDRKYAGV